MKRLGPRRRIAVITGTRAEYGLLASVIEAIAARRELRLQLVVTGMHLLQRFGATVNQIRRDGWTIDARVSMQRGDDRPLDQAEGLSRGVAGIARYLASAKTDIVVVLGDRIEALAGALAAVTTGRILAHIHGGDVAAGDFDDSVRHAVTKLAHLHFAASAAAARRIVRMGETPSRVHVVGAPGLDRLRELVARNGHARKTGRQALIVHHPIGRSVSDEEKVMTRILNAAGGAGLGGTIILPNSDRGNSGIIRAIERKFKTRAFPYPRVDGAPAWEVVSSLPRDEYLRRLIAADVLIGNSSSGIIEASVAGTAVVNIGDRQWGRDHDGHHVLTSDESPAGIQAALARALRMKIARTRSSIYGEQPAGPKIAEVLAVVPINHALRRKTLTFTVPDRTTHRPNGRPARGR